MLAPLKKSLKWSKASQRGNSEYVCVVAKIVVEAISLTPKLQLLFQYPQINFFKKKLIFLENANHQLLCTSFKAAVFWSVTIFCKAV
jgi:hypothetical protein